MKLWMIYAWETAALAALVAAGAVAVRRRRHREHRRLAIEEAQMLHDYLHAKAEVAYLELKYAADCAEEPSYQPRDREGP